MQQREQSYRLFEPSSKPWPLNNHRAEFARKLIVYAVGATVREYAGQAIAKNFHRKSNEVTSHLFFDVFELEGALISLISQSYQDLRRSNENDTDPDLSQLHTYVIEICEQRLQNAHNLLLTLIESGNDAAAQLAERERDEAAKMLEFLDTIFQKMKLYNDLGVLMQLPSFSPLLRSVLANQITLHTILVN